MKNKRGFTLIEVLASFVIISILAVSITAVIVNSITTTSNRRARILATSIAETYVNNARQAINVSKIESDLIGKEILLNQELTDDYSITLTSSNAQTYLTSTDNALYKNLFSSDQSEKINLDGTIYDSNLVTINFGVKKYTDDSNVTYKTVVIKVSIKYYDNRTMEVTRDVYES